MRGEGNVATIRCGRQSHTRTLFAREYITLRLRRDAIVSFFFFFFNVVRERICVSVVARGKRGEVFFVMMAAVWFLLE